MNTELQKKSIKVYNDYVNIYLKIEREIKNDYHRFSEKQKEYLDNYLSFYKDNRLPRFKKLTSGETTETGYKAIIAEMEKEKNKLEKTYNNIKKIKLNAKKEEKRNKKRRRNNIISNILLGFITPSIKKDDKDKKYAIEELKEGNPDYYISEVGYIDDYVVDNFFPLEQEEIDEFDDDH